MYVMCMNLCIYAHVEICKRSYGKIYKYLLLVHKHILSTSTIIHYFRPLPNQFIQQKRKSTFQHRLVQRFNRFGILKGRLEYPQFFDPPPENERLAQGSSWKKEPLQKGKVHLPNIIFQGSMLSFLGGVFGMMNMDYKFHGFPKTTNPMLKVPSHHPSIPAFLVCHRSYQRNSRA